MIKGIARSDALQNKPGGLGDDFGVARLAAAESAHVGGSQLLAQGIGQHLSWIEHDPPPLLSFGAGRSERRTASPCLQARRQTPARGTVHLWPHSRSEKSAI